jgi:hypothetical protein
MNVVKEKNYYLISPEGFCFESSNPEWHKECQVIKKKEWTEKRRDWAKSQLLETLKDNPRILCKLDHVSTSGMSRRVSVFVIKDSELIRLSQLVSYLCDYRMKEASLIIGGCCFCPACQIASDLSYSLYGRNDNKINYSWI